MSPIVIAAPTTQPRRRRAAPVATLAAVLAAATLGGCVLAVGSRGTSSGTSSDTRASAGAAIAAGGAPVTVFLARHGEKAATPGSDPELSAEGRARAEALAAALRDARLDAVFATQLRRTQDTARPAASARGLTPRVVGVGGDARAHAAAVADSVRALAAGATALVVGHSNTIPAIVTALGGPALADLCDAEYDALFVVVLRAGGAASVARTRYGTPSSLASCQAMAPR